MCVNVLEHIKDDRTALSNIIKGTTPGGHICILVPAFGWLYGTLDSLDNHFRRYTKQAILSYVKDEPVKIIRCYYFNCIGVAGWFVKGRLLRQKYQKDENYALMNMLIGLVKPLEKKIKPPLGMSLVVILRKRS